MTNLRKLFPVMTDTEFADSVNGVQKGNHWWPFVVEYRDMNQFLKSLTEARNSLQDATERLTDASTAAVLEEKQAEFLLAAKWIDAVRKIRLELSEAVELLGTK